MMRGPTQLLDFIRDDGTEVLLEYTREPYDAGNTYGPPESCYPPEGGGVDEIEATSDGVKVIEMTDAEWDRARELAEAQPMPEYEPFDDDVF
tara:strand:+ start:13368 stop:13643 length:276 start_codon:yes stop_codon:yes gene_type:complete